MEYESGNWDELYDHPLRIYFSPIDYDMLQVLWPVLMAQITELSKLALLGLEHPDGLVHEILKQVAMQVTAKNLVI